MFNLDNIGLETAFNIMRILGFLLICALGGVAWLIYFLAQEQKKPVCYNGPSDLKMQTFTLQGVYKIPVDANFLNECYQLAVARRWADPDYEVVSKARRSPFPQAVVDANHEEAIAMMASGEDLSWEWDIVCHKRLRTPIPVDVINNAHVEALKMIRRGEYD